ncbi:hypothetical protein MTE2_4674 [Klebsiella pneumoniae VA360]|jgi:hypothetical protein|nr:hypothetical protein MTE2_4674 [Klebsiella pneumoniae VA360]
MFFPYGPDHPEGAAHQLQLFSGILTQVTQRTTTLRAAGTRWPQAFFIAGE